MPSILMLEHTLLFGTCPRSPSEAPVYSEVAQRRVAQTAIRCDHAQVRVQVHHYMPQN